MYEYTPYKTYTRDNIVEALLSKYSEFVGQRKKYLNAAISFDTETSSFYYEDRKVACMYVWAVDINHVTIIGRTWEEFVDLTEQISTFYHLTENKNAIIYVHNLSYEFQFMRKWLQWSYVFAQKGRSVMYAKTTSGIEFRCSYYLYGGKLETLAKEMSNSKRSEKDKMLKLTMDYSLLRTSKTELSKDDIEYLIHDVKIIIEYIEKCIKQDGDISKIPLTKTGYVRQEFRVKCLASIPYRKLIHSMNLTYSEYIVAKDAFTGGFTHSNPNHTNEIMYNVTSFDFASSYPAVMLSEMYPMSSGKLIKCESFEEFERYMFHELCTVRLKLKDVKPKILNDFYLSVSECDDIIDSKDELDYKLRVSNGRIYSCKGLTTTITSIDYRIMSKVYEFKVDKVVCMYYYKKHFLPKSFIEVLLDLYEKKTKLKGVEGSEDLYLISKGMLNSAYGMCVTDIVRDEFPYNPDTNEWDKAKLIRDLPESKRLEIIENENKKYNRALFYLWGVFVTAYARYNLFRGIIECGNDYIYSDTDSLKIINYKEHMDFINSYNEEITKKCDFVLSYYGLDVERSRPMDTKGRKRQIGIWELEEHWHSFKTLGAKRYIYFDKHLNLHITIAGVAKKAGEKYLSERYFSEHPERINDNKFLIKHYAEWIHNIFDRQLCFPADSTGKQTHTYIDEEVDIIVTDYQGHTSRVHELSYIHLEPAEYNLSISSEYRDFLEWLKITYPQR